MIDLNSLKEANERTWFGVRILFKNGNTNTIYPVRNSGLQEHEKEYEIDSAIAPRGFLYRKEDIAAIARFDLCRDDGVCWGCRLPLPKGECKEEEA